MLGIQQKTQQQEQEVGDQDDIVHTGEREKKPDPISEEKDKDM